MENPVVSGVEEAAAEITIKTVGYGIERARNWYIGYNLLILGMERAGKTSIYNFLWRKLFARDREPTGTTVRPTNSHVFSFEWAGKDGLLELKFRNVGDFSGQIGPDKHAELFVNKMPHLVLIVLDLTQRDESSDTLHGSYERWFERFCAYVADRLKNRPRRARSLDSHLRSMVILLNKSDAIPKNERDNVIRQAKERIRAILKSHLQLYFSQKVEQFPILECCLVSNPRNDDWTFDHTRDSLREVIRKMMLITIPG
jgi:Gtr1/RagA G protein conserved region